MYTMLDLKVRLRPETPAEVWDELERMVAGEGTMGGRMAWMFHCSSAYLEDEYIKRDSVDRESRILDVGFDMKNYGEEIQKLLAWLSPHVEEVIDGWYAYEEDEEISSVSLIDGRLAVDRTRTKKRASP